MLRKSEIFRRYERQYLKEKLEPYNLTILDSMLLRLLAQQSPCRQEDLCRETEIDKSRIARSAAALEERGLLRREISNQCRREKKLELTPAGCEALKTIDEIYAAWEKICFSGFTSEERQQFESLRDRVSANAMSIKKGGIENGQKSDRG
jgi:DNA-binding MarR family transcriptional regulator